MPGIVVAICRLFSCGSDQYSCGVVSLRRLPSPVYTAPISPRVRWHRPPEEGGDGAEGKGHCPGP